MNIHVYQDGVARGHMLQSQLMQVSADSHLHSCILWTPSACAQSPIQAMQTTWDGTCRLLHNLKSIMGFWTLQTGVLAIHSRFRFCRRDTGLRSSVPAIRHGLNSTDSCSEADLLAYGLCDFICLFLRISLELAVGMVVNGTALRVPKACILERTIRCQAKCRPTLQLQATKSSEASLVSTVALVGASQIWLAGSFETCQCPIIEPAMAQRVYCSSSALCL